MRRREFITIVGSAAASWPLAAHAQQSAMKHVGVLMDIAETDATAKKWVDAFETPFAASGWRKGRDCDITYRWGGSNPELLARHAEELVRLAPDAILAHGTPAMIPLQKTHTTIPIVFTAVSDPIGQGFVASISHPGGNITGFSNFEPDIGGKWLQVLKDIAPSVTNVAVMFNPRTSPYNETLFMRSIAAAAPSFGMEPAQASVFDEDDIRKTIGLLATKPASGLLVGADAFTVVRAPLITSLAMSTRLPAIYPFRFFAQEGGLVSYGVDLDEQLRKAADYVDRILKGEKPADLPVQAPTKYELVINLKTAKALGLSVPLGLLNAADDVIE
jgi:putative tryptophan/tyrosine transport system substrate-binding protein